MQNEAFYISEEAAKKIKEILASEPQDTGIRVSVVPG